MEFPYPYPKKIHNISAQAIMKRFPFISIFFVLLWNPTLWAGEGSLKEFTTFRSDPIARIQLQEVVAVALQQAQGLKQSFPKDLAPIFQKQFAIFVTLEVAGRTRGCVGSLRPQRGNLPNEIAATLERAMYQDPQHPPVTTQEIPQLMVHLTAVGQPERVRGIQNISPSGDGALLRSGGKEAVALPGEAKTQRYLLAFLRAKAGVKKGEAFQIYRLPSVTISLLAKGESSRQIGFRL